MSVLSEQIAMLREVAAAKVEEIYRERDRQIAARERFYGACSSVPGQFIRVAPHADRRGYPEELRSFQEMTA